MINREPGEQKDFDSGISHNKDTVLVKAICIYADSQLKGRAIRIKDTLSGDNVEVTLDILKEIVAWAEKEG